MGSEPGGGELGLHLTGLKGLLRLDGGERERLRMTLRFSLTNGRGWSRLFQRRPRRRTRTPVSGVCHVCCLLDTPVPLSCQTPLVFAFSFLGSS